MKELSHSSQRPFRSPCKPSFHYTLNVTKHQFLSKTLSINHFIYLLKKNSPILLSGPDQFWENRMNVLLYLSRKWGSANLGCWHALVIKEFFCCGKASELPWFFLKNVKFKSLAIYGCEMWGCSLHYHFRTASLWGEKGGGHGTLHFVLLMDNPLGGHIHWQEETKQLWQI